MGQSLACVAARVTLSFQTQGQVADTYQISWGRFKNGSGGVHVAVQPEPLEVHNHVL